MNAAGFPQLLHETLPEYEKLCGFFRHETGCRQEAQDLTQETFFRLLRRTPVEEVEQPRGLLFRIARNLLIDRARSRRVFHPEPLTEEMEQRAVSQAATPARRAAASDELRLVQQAVAALPERCREVFVLSRFGGLSYAEIAERLAISPSTVEKHVMRAIAACKAAIQEHPAI